MGNTEFLIISPLKSFCTSVQSGGKQSNYPLHLVLQLNSLDCVRVISHHALRVPVSIRIKAPPAKAYIGMVIYNTRGGSLAIFVESLSSILDPVNLVKQTLSKEGVWVRVRPKGSKQM